MQIMLSLLGFVLGGSFLGFLQFLIHRKDERDDKIGKLTEQIKALEVKMNNRFDEIEAKEEERDAVDARIRILRFGDEVLTGQILHSRESFTQVLEDIDDYEDYSASHPLFKNNKTVTTIEYIKRIYNERLEKNDFV